MSMTGLSPVEPSGGAIAAQELYTGENLTSYQNNIGVEGMSLRSSPKNTK